MKIDLENPENNIFRLGIVDAATSDILNATWFDDMSELKAWADANMPGEYHIVHSPEIHLSILENANLSLLDRNEAIARIYAPTPAAA